ncbi:MAG: RNA 2',3'-cyclic phosphodiesterase [Methanococcoides sp.]|nr:RNA 2',3'-cyclic phosphodiesterase [Methanococcoides sp.]
MIRTFVAVDLTEEMREKIKDIQSKLEPFNLRLVDPELVHITLKFLGDVPEDRVSAISDALDSIECEPFEANIAGLGVFPKPSYVKIVWIGAEGNFVKLHDKVESSLKSFRFKKDRRGFTAHSTIARVKNIPKSDKQEFLRILDELKDVEIGKMHVDRVKFKKSTLTPEGPIYETLHEAKLG